MAQLLWQEQTLNLQQYEQEKANYRRCAVDCGLEQRVGGYEHARLHKLQQYVDYLDDCYSHVTNLEHFREQLLADSEDARENY